MVPGMPNDTLKRNNSIMQIAEEVRTICILLEMLLFKTRFAPQPSSHKIYKYIVLQMDEVLSELGIPRKEESLRR